MTTGTVKLTFDEATHTYRLGEVIVPSVTQVLSTIGLYKGKAFMTPEHAERGTRVHFLTELHDLGFSDDVQHMLNLYPHIAGYHKAYVKFLKESGFKPSLIEKRIYSLTHMYAGTLDRVGNFNGDPHILDIKSGVLQESDAIQTAGYSIALSEMEGIKNIYNRCALYLKQDGRYKLIRHIRIQDKAVFLQAIDKYNRQHPSTPHA